MKELKKEKLELTEALLEKMEALKKVKEDASGLRGIILKRQLVIDSLRPWEMQNIEEKLELRGKVQQLELSLQRREHEVKELRAELVQLNDRYREAH